MSLPTIKELMEMEVSPTSYEVVPVGMYHAVITGCKVNKGGKGPYLAPEVTIHSDLEGGEEWKGRKVWGISSFSEKALTMPGGVVNLLKVTNPDISEDLAPEERPGAIAAAVISTPVVIKVEHEQVVRNGEAAFTPDGEPEMRARIGYYEAADDDFIAAIEADAAGIDDDLPF